MKFQLHEAANFTPVVATTTAADHVVELPGDRGLKFAGLFLALSAVGTPDFTYADITKLSILGDGKTILGEMTGTQLRVVNQYHAIADNNAYVPYFFADPNAQSFFGMTRGILDTKANPFESLTVHMTLDGTQVGTTSISAKVLPIIYDGNKPAGTEREFRCLRKNTQVVGAIEERLKPSLGVNGYNNLIRGVYIAHANLSEFEAKHGSTTISAKRPIADHAYLADAFYRTPQGGYFVYDPIALGVTGHATPTHEDGGDPGKAGSLDTQLRGEFTGAETITMISDIYAHSKAAI